MMRKKTPGVIGMMDIMLMITALGAILVLFLPRINRTMEKFTSFRSKQVLEGYRSQIGEYFVDTGSYPRNWNDLQRRPEGKAGENWQGPYAGKEEEWPPTDQKGNAIIYNRPAQLFRHYKDYELYIEDPNKDTQEYVNIGQ